MNVSKGQIGLVTGTALVLGNMIGSGVFLLPASLAPYGGYSLIVLANYSHGMVAMFTFILLLSTLSNMVAYLFCAMADIVLAYRSGRPVPLRDPILACAAFAFSVWAVIGAGADAAYWNFVLLALGLPLYVWQLHRTRRVAQ